MSLRRASLVAFACSGFAGLVYQVVWMRLAFASFGVITPVLSIIVSVFMAGLGLGAVLGGRVVRTRSPREALLAYAGVELAIAALAPTIKHQLAFGQRVLLSVEGSSSVAYLVASGAVIALVLIVPTTLMGTTYPLMLAALAGTDERGFGRLYLMNTIGAATGALGSVFIIEVVGFTQTVLVAALANGTAALCAFSARSTVSTASARVQDDASPLATASVTSAKDARWLILFTTGFAAMSMEVVWSRLFAPVLGHLVYSFASLLFTFLVATAIGAALYRRGVLTRVSIDALVLFVTLAALAPIVLNDLRVAPNYHLVQWYAPLTVAPLCVLLGALTPRIIDELTGGDPKKVGRAYAINVVGCVVGPLFASYVLLPRVSAPLALAIVSAPLAFFAGRRTFQIGAAAAVLAVGALAAFTVVTYDDPVSRARAASARQLRRDHTATVISTGIGANKQLIVNGEGLTKLTPITKHMAHAPLLAVSQRRAPQSALVICLGMGTTWRSLMSWPIDATAVELLPSVVDALPYYYPDAVALLADPRGHIIVDDGRRFLLRTDQMFDVITLDPPPPLEAAGVGMLYSDELYALAKRHLRPGGVLAAWIMADLDTVELKAITRSFLDAFPYVRAFPGVENWGVHLFGSDAPIVFPAPDDIAGRLPAAARDDLQEISVSGDGLADLKLLLSREFDVTSLAGDDPRVRMTDDLPVNEYYWLRRALAPPVQPADSSR